MCNFANPAFRSYSAVFRLLFIVLLMKTLEIHLSKKQLEATVAKEDNQRDKMEGRAFLL